MDNITDLLKQMKMADKPRVEKEKIKKTPLTDKQKYLRSLMKGRKLK